MNSETAIIELENVRDHVALAEQQLAQLNALFSAASKLSREEGNSDKVRNLLGLGGYVSCLWADNMDGCLSDVDDRLKRVTA